MRWTFANCEKCLVENYNQKTYRLSIEQSVFGGKPKITPDSLMDRQEWLALENEGQDHRT